MIQYTFELYKYKYITYKESEGMQMVNEAEDGFINANITSAEENIGYILLKKEKGGGYKADVRAIMHALNLEGVYEIDSDSIETATIMSFIT